MNNVHTLILNHAGMGIGGIEVTFAKLMRYCLEQGYRVIWITNRSCYETASFRDVVDDSRVEKIFLSTGKKLLGGVGNLDIPFNTNENVTMISCDVLNFADADGLRKKAKVQSFYHFMLLPHYTGSAYYPERLFKKKGIRALCYKEFKSIANRLEQQNCVRAFSEIQLTAYEDNYKIKIDEKDNKTLKAISSSPVLDTGRLEKRASERKSKIVITTCARFDFPHKAYLLGLIDAFKVLAAEYDSLYLVIVGYGLGQDIINKKISELPPKIADRIKLAGKKSLDELIEIFNKSTINVGLAGALLDGAGCGLPSLVVQHYSYECGCFGFLEDVKTDIAEGQGKPIIPYLKEIIQCSNEEYVNHGEKAYEVQEQLRESQPEYIFEQKNSSSQRCLSQRQRLFCKFIHCIATVKYRIFKESGFSED